ncbi:hypothetical protein L211DRAFT_854139 [Terfezia boudieri ATCC MYA-4762]|uniref:Uncharacterized protein n=1 Tax=Terfezia boudieri ATCC MYA-4762 TaxID=1051890 RepID=A0A3N4LKG1_9PEZI|nr:hypothetical protein L211DRAFT_854139 [Terfezia boudieri ATCC MYA-4762]
MEIIEKGLKEADMLFNREGGISSRSDTPVSSTIQSYLEERSRDLNFYSIVKVDDTMNNSVDKDKVEELDIPDSESPLDLETEVTKLPSRALDPLKLRVPVVVCKRNKKYLDLKAVEKRIRAELDSNEKEELDNNKAECQKKDTKMKKSNTKLDLEDLISI